MTEKSKGDGGNLEQNAILLKVTQAMARLGVAACPRNYELFHMALSGRNSALTRDMAALGGHPDQAVLDQVGIKYHLPGFLALAGETIRMDMARSVSALSRSLGEDIGRKQGFAGALRDFISRLETDPVAGMSDFAEEAGRLRDAAAAFERAERAAIERLSEALAELGRLHEDAEVLRKAATRDPVTGLANRAAFSARLLDLYDGETAAAGSSLAVVTIEGLREMGERHGQAVADRALKKLAPLFRKSVKKNDFVARLAKDQFAFLLHDASADNAVAIAGRIRASVEALTFSLPERAFTTQSLSLSAGIAVTGTAAGGVDLLAQAELALQAARAAGRPDALVFSAAIGSRTGKIYTPQAA